MPNAATTTKIANRLNLKGLCGCYIIPQFIDVFYRNLASIKKQVNTYP